ncbi:hypothetical protein [Cardinium endosymbiont of Tipula unca]|uniref:hypothetical protein n=1 Tax=Cardinium endosymbiont of Tipula unca TaxID=3066216 RepID=UPI0030CB006A
MTVSGNAAKLKRGGFKKMPNTSLEKQPIYAIPRQNPKKVTKSDYDKIAMELDYAIPQTNPKSVTKSDYDKIAIALDYAIPQTNPKSVTQKNNSELVVQEKVGSVCKVTPSISHAPTKNGLDNIAYKSQIKTGSRIKARQEKTQKPFLLQAIIQPTFRT